MCDRLEMVVVGVYIPPPATLTILHKIAPIFANYSRAAVLLAGDFNMPNPSLDKFNPDLATGFPLARWADVYGLTDVWIGDILERGNICVILLRLSFSRIDLFYASGPLLSHMRLGSCSVLSLTTLPY